MKLAVFSDLHVTNKNSKFRIDNDGVSDLLKAQEAFVEWMCKEVEDNEIDGLVFLGDFTDYSTLDPITATYANRIVSRIVRLQRPTLLIGGNHTTADQKAQYTVLGAVRELVEQTHVQFVTQSTQVEFDGLPGLSFYCFPYVADFDHLVEQIRCVNDSLQASESDSTDVMLFHFPIINAQLDNGLKSPHGVEMRQEDVCNFDLVLGGDFHRAQKLDGLEAAYYVGAPFDLKFNEETDFPRGYVTIDFEDKTRDWIEWSENPYWYRMLSVDGEVVTPHWIDSIKSPEKMILRVKGELAPELKAELEEMDFYRFSHIKARTAKKIKKDFMVIESGDDHQMVDKALDQYDVDDALKERARGLFSMVKGRV